MSKHPLSSWLAGVAALLVGTVSVSAAAVTPDPPTRARVSAAYGRLPLSFEANAGQSSPGVLFLSRGPGYALFLTEDEAVLSLRGAGREEAVVRMEVAGGRRASRIVGLDPQATKSNYLLGNDPSRWHTGVPHFARVRYENVYPGVDLVFRGNQRQIEYDLTLAPGAEPGTVRLAFHGADSITLGARGELILHTAQGDLVQPPPVVYQEMGEERRPVEGRYVLLARRAAGDSRLPAEVGFRVGRYDRSRPLIIDPVLRYSTFLGGDGDDVGAAIAVDGAGNAYLTGETEFGTTFPGVDGNSIQPTPGGIFGDVFVTKLNPTGTAILYSTFLGGSGVDVGRGIAVDGQGNAYVTGGTSSTTFPGVNAGSLQPANGGGLDAFVTKLNPAGTAIVYATFLGGAGDEQGFAIAVDGLGNAYVTGGTNSTTFPGVNASSIQPAYGGGTEDAFVTKLDASGTAIVYSTFLGGPQFDEGDAIALDALGETYITGSTSSPTFPGVNASSIQPAYGGGSEDPFVIKLNPSGTAIAYSTFLGGSDFDRGTGIAVDATGSAYVTGMTSSIAFPGVDANSLQPVYGGGTEDAFVTKLSPAGTAIAYSTFLGGGGSETGGGIAVDAAGNAYVTGATSSLTFPGVNAGSLQPANGGQGDAFVAKLDPAGRSLLFSTFLGGGMDDGGNGIAVDAMGNVYVTGRTASPTFPGVNGSSLQPASGGGASFFSDAFVTKIAADSIVTVPALDPLGLSILALLLAALGVGAMKRRRNG